MNLQSMSHFAARFVAGAIVGVGLLAAVGAAMLSAADDKYERPVIQAPVCEAPPVIDGVLDDACWQQAYHSGDFWNTRDQCAPNEGTEVWLCVDAEAFYAAVYCHDSQPQHISCQETKRGGDIWNDDYVTVGIDADHCGERIYTFHVTANGTQCEDIPGGSDAKIEWRGDWQAAGRVVDDGWVAEVRIPFSILRYPAGQSVWGVFVRRHHARTSNMFNWPPQPEQWDSHEIAELRGLKLPVFKARPVIMPNVQTEWGAGRLRTNWSLDAKYTHKSGVTAVLSLTPDFRNIEDEVESIDFSYTERWYRDRRPFFVEGEDYMPPGTIFYSRRIPEFDVGVKAFGSVGGTTVGLLDAWSATGRNDMAVALRQTIARDHRVELGYVSTHQPEVKNKTYYVGGRYYKRFGSGYFRVRTRLFHSRTAGGDDGKAFSINLRRQLGRNKPRLWVEYERVDPTFDPVDGYAPDVDLEGVSGGIGLWRSFDNRRTEWSGFHVNAGSYRHTDGSAYHDDIEVGWWTSYRDGTSWEMEWNYSDRPPNVDRVWGVGIGWNGKRLHQEGEAGIRWGRYSGADYLYYNISQGLKIGTRLYLQARYEYRQSDYPGTGDDERIGRGIVGFNYDLTPSTTI